jgi:hypothetical protein
MSGAGRGRFMNESVDKVVMFRAFRVTVRVAETQDSMQVVCRHRVLCLLTAASPVIRSDQSENS